MSKKHRWNVTEQEAISIQRSIAREVEKSDRLNHIQHIAGVDISSNDDSQRIHAVAVEFSVEKNKSFSDTFKNPLDYSYVMMLSKFRYTPGLLAFREGPLVILAIEYLTYIPDLIVYDAHGYSHPRQCGLASHLGVYLDIPSIGCAKKLLFGNLIGTLGEDVGSSVPIVHDGEQIGTALRTKKGEDPVYVSVGHRVSLDRAVQIVSWLTNHGQFRVPITTKWAHIMSNHFRKK